MNTIFRAACLVAMSFLVASTAWAMPTADLTVTGVIRPQACALTLAGGGVVDLGVIPAGSLPKGRHLLLPPARIDLAINCAHAARLALRQDDNRAASHLPGLFRLLPKTNGEYQMFGLGTVNGQKVGGYRVSMLPADVTGDGVPVDVVYRDPGSYWIKTPNGFMSTNGAVHAWSKRDDDTAAPDSFRSIAATLTVEAVLQKPESLPLEREVPLDGSLTFELVYF